MENEEKTYLKKLRHAQKRVKNIKGFYRHLTVYILMNIIIFIFEIAAFNLFAGKGIDPNGLRWLRWNMMGIPLVWGVGLLFHAIYVFVLKSGTLSDLKPKLLKDWEERQIAKYMNEH